MAKNKITLSDVLTAAWRERPAPIDGTSPSEHDPLLRAVQQYQMTRLRATYADFSAQPQYARLTRFFLGELYGPYDFTQRTGRLHQLHDWLSRLSGAEPLKPMTNALALQRLSDDLDAGLTAMLRHMGMDEPLTTGQYEQAYRRCDNYDLRQVQIELIVDTFETLHPIVHLPFTGLQVKALQAPARALGWSSMAEFLKHGYDAMKPIGDIRPFTGAVYEREMKILDRIYLFPADAEVM